MTINEAVRQLEFDREMICFDPTTGEEIPLHMLKTGNMDNYLTYLADGMAIEALKEIQQYRKIGTVEECREMASIISKVERNELAKIIDEWLLYKKIGTVEECREAVEKQKPKKPKDELTINPVIDENGAYVDADMTVYLLCPNCGEMVGIDENIDRFCSECGQAIDNDNLEGMEDEEN